MNCTYVKLTSGGEVSLLGREGSFNKVVNELLKGHYSVAYMNNKAFNNLGLNQNYVMLVDDLGLYKDLDYNPYASSISDSGDILGDVVFAEVVYDKSGEPDLVPIEKKANINLMNKLSGIVD